MTSARDHGLRGGASQPVGGRGGGGNWPEAAPGFGCGSGTNIDQQ